MNALEIKHALEIAGSSQADIARKCGVSETMVAYVRKGVVSRHIREKIAETIKIPVEEIWPEYYARKKSPA
jgi:lambda repressor-like predicted transcriptional regulator